MGFTTNVLQTLFKRNGSRSTSTTNAQRFKASTQSAYLTHEFSFPLTRSLFPAVEEKIIKRAKGTLQIAF